MNISHRRWKRLGSSIKAESLILPGPINPLQRAVRVKTSQAAAVPLKQHTRR
jgi:hypothetical protein